MDKDTNNVLKFDKVIDNEIRTVEKTLNQGRIQLRHSTNIHLYITQIRVYFFLSSAVFVPSEFQRSGKMYETMLNNFIRQHKPFIVKGSDGSIYIADISNPKINSNE